MLCAALYTAYAAFDLQRSFVEDLMPNSVVCAVFVLEQIAEGFGGLDLHTYTVGARPPDPISSVVNSE